MNKKVRITWISFGDWRSYWFTAVGIHTIAGYIQKYYEGNLIQDVWYYDNRDSSYFLKHISKKIPHYICFSINLGYYNQAVELIKKIQNSLKSDLFKYLRFILGNRVFLEYTNVEGILRIIPDALVIKGEGEDAVLKIINKEKLENIPNLYYKTNSKEIRYTYDNEFDPDNYIAPCMEIDIINRKNVRLNETVACVEVSRGCSKKSACTFCPYSIKGVNKNWKILNISEVIKNIKQCAQRKPIAINFISEDFLGGGKDSITSLLNQIEKMRLDGSIDKKTNFYCAIRVSDVFRSEDSKEENEAKIILLKKMKNIGFNTLYLGFESGSDEQLKRFNKGVTRLENMKAIQILKELEIHIDGGFITFDPLMTLEDCLQNISFLEECNVPKLLLFPFNRLIVFPNTGYYLMILRKGNKINLKVRKLLEIVENVDKCLPYNLFEIFLQKLRVFYFADNKEKIKKYESISMNYGSLCFPFIKELVCMLLNNETESLINNFTRNFLEKHTVFCQNLKLWFKKEESELFSKNSLPQIENIREHMFNKYYENLKEKF